MILNGWVIDDLWNMLIYHITPLDYEKRSRFWCFDTYPMSGFISQKLGMTTIDPMFGWPNLHQCGDPTLDSYHKQSILS